jgi:hypothetical protein
MENLVRQFQEDATTLVETLVTTGPLRPSKVRAVASSVVRKWLIDGHINQLSRVVGETLTLPVVGTDKAVVEIAADPQIRFFMAGGVALDGEPLRGMYLSDAPFMGQVPISREGLATVMLKPSQYLKSPRIYFDGQWFTAEQVIRFVANKHGGVHLDSSRDQEWQNILERASRFFLIGNPDHLEERQIIEKSSPEHEVLVVLPRERGVVWTCLEIELLSAAQALVSVHAGNETLLDLPVGESNDKAEA